MSYTTCRRGLGPQQSIFTGACWIALFVLLVQGAAAPADAAEPGVAASMDRAQWRLELFGDARGELLESPEGTIAATASHDVASYTWASLQPTSALPLERGKYQLKAELEGEGVGRVFLGVRFEGAGGDARLYLPEGDFETTAYELEFETPAGATGVLPFVGFDGSADRLAVHEMVFDEREVVRVRAVLSPRPHDGIMPGDPAEPRRAVAVLSTEGMSPQEELLAASLQGFLNRERPRLYLLNRPNDAFWLDWMMETGSVREVLRLETIGQALALFPDAPREAVIYDEALPGAVHGAMMLGALDGRLPATEELATALNLTVAQDVRGRWSRNVDAYAELWDQRRDEFASHLLAVHYPLTNERFPADYLYQNRVFTFWRSGYPEKEVGADVPAEAAFSRRVLRETPVNIPVLGWWSFGTAPVRGVHEFEALNLCSAHGKFLAVSEFSSNLSFLSLIAIDESALRQKAPTTPPGGALNDDLLYASLSIIDSGDSLWYWQDYMLKAWLDEERGSVPVSWSLNPTLLDAAPPVLDWYYRHATENDAFFAAMSGLGYTNAAVYASAFTPEDQEAVWADYLSTLDDYCRRLDLDLVAMHVGGWDADATREADVHERYFAGTPSLTGILSEFGRHDSTTPDDAVRWVAGKPVFHTMMRWNTWTEEMGERTPESEIAFTVKEFGENSPTERPAVMSGLALSWTMFPTQIRAAYEALPPDVQPVTVRQLPGLARQIRDSGANPSE